jgi:Domain of unknown function (DUF5667)
MRIARLVFLLAALGSTPTQAGHGLLNSFNDIEWLATPAVTPDVWYYRAVTMKEALALRLADSPAEKATLCAKGLREKLAEALAMAKANKPQASALALSRYRDYLDCVTALAAAGTPADLPLRLATALLEQRYMISVEFADLPTTGRAPLERWMDEVAQHYEKLRAGLPHATRESLFFKEEEVRWSWQMGQQGVPDTPPPAL